MINIAVVGAGLCGLAVCWHLLDQYPSRLSITLFDSQGIGSGASGISAGLLHPFAGAYARLNFRGREGIAATHALLAVSKQALGSSVIRSRGLLRLALTAEQQSDFALCAQTHSEVSWKEIDETQQLVPGIALAPGIWIPDALVIDTPLYLAGLWKACQAKGQVNFVQQTVHRLKELAAFDAHVITTGASLTPLEELSSLPIHCIKGQLLELQWPVGYPPLPCAINSQAYLTMSASNTSCYAGATFERDYHSEEAQPEQAWQLLQDKIAALYPPLANAPIIDCRAGLRASAPRHLPLVRWHPPRSWVLTGMGSKGLLYHALYAKELVASMRL